MIIGIVSNDRIHDYHVGRRLFHHVYLSFLSYNSYCQPGGGDANGISSPCGLITPTFLAGLMNASAFARIELLHQKAKINSTAQVYIQSEFAIWLVV